jgi:hypothetical protein
MLNDILKIANRYAEGVKHVQQRRDQWITKHVEVKDRLKEIANYLNENATYKQGFFIDILHAFNQDMHGTCADMPSITFRSGEMPMLVKFRNSMGERKEYVEEGFSITFSPTITGQIIILLSNHYSDLNQEPPPYATLAVIDDPELLTMELVDKVITRGMEAAYRSSFTGMSEQHAVHEQEEEILPQVKRNPIGFKRYETTQKIG